jgi:hypothetical protein
MCKRLHVKYALFLSDFSETLIFRQIFEKKKSLHPDTNACNLATPQYYGAQHAFRISFALISASRPKVRTRSDWIKKMTSHGNARLLQITNTGTGLYWPNASILTFTFNN